VHPISEWQAWVGDFGSLGVFALSWIGMRRHLRWAPLVAAGACITAKSAFFFTAARDAGSTYAESGVTAFVAALYGFALAPDLVILGMGGIMIALSFTFVSRRVTDLESLSRNSLRGGLRCLGVLYGVATTAAGLGGIWDRTLLQHLGTGILLTTLALGGDFALGHGYDRWLEERLNAAAPPRSTRGALLLSLVLVGGLPAYTSHLLVAWMPERGLYPQTPLFEALVRLNGPLREVVNFWSIGLLGLAACVTAILVVRAAWKSVLFYFAVISSAFVAVGVWWSIARLDDSPFATTGMLAALLFASILGSTVTAEELKRLAPPA
jgi:hypothetical protein